MSAQQLPKSPKDAARFLGLIALSLSQESEIRAKYMPMRFHQLLDVILGTCQIRRQQRLNQMKTLFKQERFSGQVLKSDNFLHIGQRLITKQGCFCSLYPE